MELLPSIDLRRGRVVRLRQGDDGARTDYGGDPLQVLERYAAAGVRWIHLVDLDAAFGEAGQWALVAELVAAGRRHGLAGLQLGGGLRDRQAVATALEAGCERVVLGSLVGRRPEEFRRLAEDWPERLVPALDVRRGAVRLEGWTVSADRSLDELCAALRSLPCPGVLVTDISRDGTLDGPNLELTAQVGAASALPAWVSGGVRSLGDLEAARDTPGIAGAVVGRALYEEAFTIGDAVAVCRQEVAP
ncbi:MAG: HisA/HisF-related TIM barrel protein [Acidobacteriota bacterium]